VAGRTLTEKIIADHLAGGNGEEIELWVDQILLEDATGTMACLQFEQLGLDRVAVPTVSYVDHNVIQFDNKNPEDHAYLRSWAARYGALYSRPGNGISHYLHLERFSRPGARLLGATATRRWPGALGMLAIGAGATEVAVAMAGRPYAVERPLVVGVELRGGSARGCSRRTSCSSCCAGAACAAGAGASSSSTATASRR
jgi:aconitate hydratase